MTNVVILTGGDGLATPSFATGLGVVLAAKNATLTTVSLRHSTASADAGVPVLVLGKNGGTQRVGGRVGRVVRGLANRWNRMRLWHRIASTPAARDAVAAADIIWIDGEFPLLAGWRVARLYPKPWVVLGHGAVATLLANGYRVGN